MILFKVIYYALLFGLVLYALGFGWKALHILFGSYRDVPLGPISLNPFRSGHLNRLNMRAQAEAVRATTRPEGKAGDTWAKRMTFFGFLFIIANGINFATANPLEIQDRHSPKVRALP